MDEDQDPTHQDEPPPDGIDTEAPEPEAGSPTPSPAPEPVEGALAPLSPPSPAPTPAAAPPAGLSVADIKAALKESQDEEAHRAEHEALAKPPEVAKRPLINRLVWGR